MKKQYIVIAVIVLAVIVVALFLKGSGSDESTIVSSSDGRATLEVPKNALPEGMDPSTLNITMLESPGDAIATYELGPDGTVFKKPVTFIVTYPFDEEGDIPVLITEGENGPEVVSDIDLELNEDADLITLRAPLSHFSRYVALAGFFRVRRVDIREGGTHAIGEVFPVNILFFVNKTHSFTLESRDSGTHELVSTLLPRTHVNATWNSRQFKTEIANPARRETEQEFGLDDFTISQNFICKYRGNDHIRTRMRFAYGYSSYFADEGPNSAIPYFHSFNFTVLTGVRCVEPPGSDDRTGAVQSDGSTTTHAGDPDRVTHIWVKIGNSYFPDDQFVVANVDHLEPENSCKNDRGADAMYYKPKEGNQVRGTRSLSEYDPITLTNYNAGGCGFGLYDDLERINAEGPVIP